LPLRKRVARTPRRSRVARTPRRPRSAEPVVATSPARPDKAERRYTRELVAYASKVREVHPAIVRAYRRALADESRADSPQTRLDNRNRRAVQRAAAAAQRRFNARRRAAEQRNLVEEAARQVNEHNREAQIESIASARGNYLRAADANVQEQMRSFARRNIELIEKIDTKHFERINKLIDDAWRNQWPVDKLADELAQRVGMARRHAELIAADQILSLDAELSRVRQEAAGIVAYIWTTVGDARVRKLHVGRSGKRYANNARFSDGAPGEPIRCRCWRTPIVGDPGSLATPD